MQAKSSFNKDYAVVADNLTKNFGDFVAVDNVSFRVKRGEVFGFLGQRCWKVNNSGMLCGFSLRQKDRLTSMDLIYLPSRMM